MTVCLARPTAGTVSVCEKLEHAEPANLLGSEMQLLCLKQTRLHVRAVPMSSCGDLQLSENLERTAETAPRAIKWRNIAINRSSMTRPKARLLDTAQTL